ncbi:MAG: hypothetical protein RIQ90_216 [Bacteroidota bacterium]|jgi:hypothetical protein
MLKSSTFLQYLFFLFLLIPSVFQSYGQSKPYSNGVYDFGVFNKEYGRTTARCKVIINEGWVTVKITKPLMEGICSVNDILFSGKITKHNGLYYIVENGRGPGQVDDFEYETPRIDFNRKFVIHN